jgi:hypothetical protein
MTIDHDAIRQLANKFLKQSAAPVEEIQGTATALPGQAPPAGAMPPGAMPPGGAPPGGQMPVDPATGMPVDPATGMPIDPATGAPMDPAAMGMPPQEDPVMMLMEKLDQAAERDGQILKMLEQVRMIVSTIVDTAGIQIPTGTILAAGEDVVKETAEKAKTPEDTSAKEAHEMGGDTFILVDDVMEEIDNRPRHADVNNKAASLLRRWK